MRTTRYFIEMRKRPDRAAIQDAWIEAVMRSPDRRTLQADGRVWLWGRIDEAQGRYLRVVVLEDGETVHNAFFDRSFQP